MREVQRDKPQSLMKPFYGQDSSVHVLRSNASRIGRISLIDLTLSLTNDHKMYEYSPVQPLSLKQSKLNSRLSRLDFDPETLDCLASCMKKSVFYIVVFVYVSLCKCFLGNFIAVSKSHSLRSFNLAFGLDCSSVVRSFSYLRRRKDFSHISWREFGILSFCA